MNQSQITVSTTVHANVEKAWDYYTNPKHIVNWNFADPSWHCPHAVNDMRIGGTYKARMEAKDGSFGFDFEAVYSEISEGQHFTYEFGGRHSTVTFKSNGGSTDVTVVFDPEDQNSIDMQQAGWQAILNNYKQYTENN